MDLATALLVPLLAALLLAAALAATRLVRAWRADDGAVVGPEAADRVALADEHRRLRLALEDLALERALGKLSSDDYSALRGHYEQQAARVGAALEARG